MSCFSISYTRYCLTIKSRIISIRFRDVFKLFAIVELFQKRNFNSLFLSVWKVWNLVHTFSLFFFSFDSSFLSSPLLSPSYSLFTYPILSSLLHFPILFSPFIFSSLLFTPFLFSSHPLYFSSLRLILQPIPFFPDV